jgi:hypothetical protein
MLPKLTKTEHESSVILPSAGQFMIEMVMFWHRMSHLITWWSFQGIYHGDEGDTQAIFGELSVLIDMPVSFG